MYRSEDIRNVSRLAAPKVCGYVTAEASQLLPENLHTAPTAEEIGEEEGKRVNSLSVHLVLLNSSLTAFEFIHLIIYYLIEMNLNIKYAYSILPQTSQGITECEKYYRQKTNIRKFLKSHSWALQRSM